jgi:hypothetical protein
VDSKSCSQMLMWCVRYWSNSGQSWNLAGNGLSANEP